jgi:predicted membrane-bound spermidine synthase
MAMKDSAAAGVAALTGAAVMGLELTAVRLMAPHFGDSAYVWTNVIGVILVALALGAFLGGRMADRELGAPRLFRLLLVAGLLTCLVPVIAHPVGAWLVPGDLPLDSAMGALVRGSLAATTMLFAVPILLIACVSPILVTMLASVDGKIGRAAGLVSAMGTLGSLIGTFAATHVLIPEFGSTWTVWICAGALFAAAFLCKRSGLAAAAVLLPVGLSFVVSDVAKVPGTDETLLAEIESNYQFLQVVEWKDPAGGAAPTRRRLKINEGLDSFHSVAIEGTAFTDGGYYDYHVTAPYLARDGGSTEGVRVLSLGEAAGTFGRLFAHVHPGATMDGVEIDPEVTRLGAELFPGARLPGTQYPVDARVFVDNTKSRYDVVLVDTYKNQIYIPPHIASFQFFSSVWDVLEDGGVVSVNAGGFRFADPVVAVLAQTMAARFGETWAFRVPNSRNFVLVARKGKKIDSSCLQRVVTRDATLADILLRMAPPVAWRRFVVTASELGDDSIVIRDDRPVLDVLQEDAYSRETSDPILTAITGDQASRTVEAEAHGLYRQGRLEDALARIRTAEAATPRLRRYAGDCRWGMRDTVGAVLEYEEAKRLGMDPVQLDTLIGYAEEETDGRRRAWAAAATNGWIALGALLALLASFLVVWRLV